MDPKDQSWMQAIWNVSLAQLAYNLAWEKCRVDFAQEVERNKEDAGSVDLDDSGFFEGESQTKPSAALDNIHLADETQNSLRHGAHRSLHSTPSPDVRDGSNVVNHTRAMTRRDDDDDVHTLQPQSAITSTMQGAGKTSRLAPQRPSTSRNQYAVPMVALTKKELLKFCKHFRYRTNKFKGLPKDSNEIRSIHLSLRECAKLSRDRASRGHKWVFRSPRNVDDPEHYKRMVAINNPKYDKLQRSKIRAGLLARGLDERPDDSEDESLSEDKGQYDSDYESDEDGPVGSSIIPKLTAGRDAQRAPKVMMAMGGLESSEYDASEDATERRDFGIREPSVDTSVGDEEDRHWIGGKTSWPTQNGTATWNPSSCISSMTESDMGY
ncbi:hypothetical protein IFR05_006077 [Cadophora sp. M221]|nr:hypothetical protein IFR05_006077 [Cadophora sp. M221]